MGEQNLTLGYKITADLDRFRIDFVRKVENAAAFTGGVSHIRYRHGCTVPVCATPNRS